MFFNLTPVAHLMKICGQNILNYDLISQGMSLENFCLVQQKSCLLRYNFVVSESELMPLSAYLLELNYAL